MDIFLLNRETDRYDEVRGFVVRASSEGEARMLAAGQAGDEGADEWLLNASCTVIGKSNSEASGVVLRDYKVR